MQPVRESGQSGKVSSWPGPQSFRRISDCYRKVKSVKSALRQKIKTMQPEATYLCDHCGEEIVIPIDSSAGSHQEYIEDCPVCCNPMLIHVQLDDLGDAVVWSEAESEGNG